ncbi:transferrin-binding protein-like solute binding protein [Sulfuricella sp.]|uniref:transferrin-binding protein-like solute binding protein n=1 Tax=Sulfuricella sp. TaxID=2099377 RepID=UPI002BC0104F|nr:transferrin-binding protein-like solute binding protein [Sulfuricella sp.]HUX63118.1 transferrin-binding protein-like solute binding protein [Sulfuricella sp.]
MKKTIFFILLAVSLISAGCGGGGGGGGVDTPSIVRPSYSDLTNLASPVRMDIGSVTSFNNSTADYPATTLTPQITANASSLASITIVIPELGVNDTYTSADVVSTGVIGNMTIPIIDAVKTSGGVTREFVYIQPATSSSLRYSSLGIWRQTDASSLTDMAFISFGSKTAGSDIPTAGTATYTGAILGFATEGVGANYTIKAPAIAIADFGARSVMLASTLSIKTDQATLLTSSDNNYNLSGTLTYAAGNNALSGTISTVGKTGTATGVFYGPQAAEIGGTFRTSEAGGTKMFAGGFGLKQ